MEPTDGAGADTSDPLAGLALPPDVYIYPQGDKLPGMDEQIVEVTGCSLETAKWAIEAAGAGRGLLERAVDLVLTVSRSDSTEKYKVVCPHGGGHCYKEYYYVYKYPKKYYYGK